MKKKGLLLLQQQEQAGMYVFVKLLDTHKGVSINGKWKYQCLFWCVALSHARNL